METRSRLRITFGNLEFEAEGSEDFIERQLERVLSRIPFNPISDSQESIHTHTKPNTSSESLPHHVHQATRAIPSLAEFYATRAPKTDVERVVTAAAYLRDYLGNDEIAVATLHPYFQALSASGQQPPGNIQNGLWNAAAKGRGYLERVENKRGVYRLTRAGEALVYSIPKPQLGNQ